MNQQIRAFLLEQQLSTFAAHSNGHASFDRASFGQGMGSCPSGVSATPGLCVCRV
jgi:hypothetical protein